MKSMNKVQLLGYLYGDPVIGEDDNGELFAKVRLMTSYRLRTNEVKTTWHDVLFWGEAKIKLLSNQFISGSHVLIEGTIQYKKYTNAKGTVFRHPEINAVHFMNLDH